MKIQETFKKITKTADTISNKLGIFKYFIGIIIVLIGTIFMVTPFTPGAVFIIILGLQIIGIHLIKEK